MVLVDLFQPGKNPFWGDRVHRAGWSFSDNFFSLIVDELLDRAGFAGVVKLETGVTWGEFNIWGETVIVNPVLTKSIVCTVTKKRNLRSIKTRCRVGHHGFRTDDEVGILRTN